MIRAHAAAFAAAFLLSTTSSAHDSLFDGPGGPAEQESALEQLRSSSVLEPAPAPSFQLASAAAAPKPAPQRVSADLFYFTPEEGAEAAKRFGIKDFSDKPGFTFDDDVPADIRRQMLDDLAFMKGIQGKEGSPLHQKIFGAVDGAAYAKFFDTRVKGIGMSGCGSPIAVACVSPLRGPSKMWLTQNFVKFSHPQVSRMMVVYHEARHTEVRSGFWSHARCPSPFKGPDGRDMTSIWTGVPLAGEPACDKTPLGSYGSSAIMLKNIQKSCANCTDKVKMDAGFYADDQVNRVTDEVAKKQILDDLYR